MKRTVGLLTFSVCLLLFSNAPVCAAPAPESDTNVGHGSVITSMLSPAAVTVIFSAARNSKNPGAATPIPAKACCDASRPWPCLLLSLSPIGLGGIVWLVIRLRRKRA